MPLADIGHDPPDNLLFAKVHQRLQLIAKFFKNHRHVPTQYASKRPDQAIYQHLSFGSCQLLQPSLALRSIQVYIPFPVLLANIMLVAKRDLDGKNRKTNLPARFDQNILFSFL